MSIRIMDCTLRDGSYAINFGFDRATTEYVSAALDKNGIPLIEVGHGAGIGAYKKLRPALETDLTYARAAQAVVSRGKWGMFAIAGLATSEEILELRAEGMGFVRVGIDVDSLEEGIATVAKLSSSGLEIFVNFMKSYALPPAELVVRAKKVLERHPVSGIYLVDSAGGMLPDEILDYANALLELRPFVELGFHGHDNLGLSVSNSILVARKGFSLIDSTLQGLGRSSGNAPTERLLATFLKLGLVSGYDLKGVLKLSDAVIRPIIPFAGHSGLDTMAGNTLFHTSHMEKLLEYSQLYDVDPYALMERMCQLDVSSFSVEALKVVSEALKLSGSVLDSPLPADYYPGDEENRQ
jgi:4-hydroxy 2-oxovalerate aldolase